MGDDLLGDILRNTTGDGPVKPAGGGSFGDVIGQAVSRPSRPAPSASEVDLSPLAALDADAAAAFLRYLPSDLVVPLLARAPVAVAQRLVGAMDAESRAWLQSQNEEIEAVGAGRHASAAVKAMNLLQRLREDGRLAPAAPAAKPAAAPAQSPLPAAATAAGTMELNATVQRPAPIAASFSVGRPPAAAAESPATMPPPVADPTVEILADLVDAARGRRPGELRQLASGLDHPVLAEGLRRVADGGDPHELDAALRFVITDHLEAEERRLELMRRALMAIRFGDSADRFRAGL